VKVVLAVKLQGLGLAIGILYLVTSRLRQEMHAQGNARSKSWAAIVCSAFWTAIQRRRCCSQSTCC